MLINAVTIDSGCANLPEQNKVYQPDKPLKLEIIQKAQRLQMPFVANEGQMDGNVSFYAKTFGGTVFVTKKGEIVYSLPMNSWESGVENSETQVEGSGGEVRSSETESRNQKQKLNPKSNITGIVLKEEIVGAQVKTVQGEQPSVTKANYFKGNDPSQWKTNISAYNEVNLGEVSEGIGLRLRAYGNNVEKLFCVKPGANPDQIIVHLNGAKSIRVNEEGLLEVDTELGPVSFTKPIAYQEIDGKRVEVAAEYVIRDRGPFSNKNTGTDNGHETRTYSFTVASYDKTKELVVDPLLASTYLGGASFDIGYIIAIDSVGNVYVAGQTLSTDFPTTSGVYDTSNNDGDVFVSKLNGDLTSLLASTYLGGSADDFAFSLGINANGSICVAGWTSSTNFPTTAGAYDTSYNSGMDAFVSILNGDLTNLIASTYLGGSQDDNSEAISIDSSQNIYIVGRTSSTNFPTTVGAYDTSYNSGMDAFVSILNGDLTNLIASTYLGGNQDDLGGRIALKTDGNIYVTGATSSGDFPTTAGAYNILNNGGLDAFVSKLNNNLTSLLASTYLGGSADDYGGPIGIDSDDNVYVSVQTYSSNFPTTAGAYDTSYNGSLDSAVSKLDGNLTNILASTYLGGSTKDIVYSMSMNSSGNVYVTGWTNSTDFPTTMEAFDTSFNGYPWDAFISKFNGDLTSLFASTYLGGSVDDLGYSIAINSDGSIYVSGAVKSPNFPITPGAYGSSFSDTSGAYDAFISKFDSNLSASPTAIELVSFTASTNDNGTVNLIWETATEVDNAGFNIYRAKSKDVCYKNINDELIGAKGNAVAEATYNFMDTPGRGTFYYKLEDVDYSGATTMHGPIKVRIKSITD